MVRSAAGPDKRSPPSRREDAKIAQAGTQRKPGKASPSSRRAPKGPRRSSSPALNLLHAIALPADANGSAARSRIAVQTPQQSAAARVIVRRTTAAVHHKNEKKYPSGYSRLERVSIPVPQTGKLTGRSALIGWPLKFPSRFAPVQSPQSNATFRKICPNPSATFPQACCSTSSLKKSGQ